MLKNQICSILPKDFPSNCYINVLDNGKLVNTEYEKKIEEIVRNHLGYGYQVDSVTISMEIFVKTGRFVSVLFRIVDDDNLDVIL